MTQLTRAVARLLLAPSIAAAMAILVKGYADTGDGFSAGVFVALAVLLQYAAFGHREVERWLPVRRAPALAWAGLLLSLAVVFFPLLLGGPPVSHLPAPGGHVTRLGSLELHTAVLFDVGVFLLVVGFTVGIIDAIARRTGEEKK